MILKIFNVCWKEMKRTKQIREHYMLCYVSWIFNFILTWIFNFILNLIGILFYVSNLNNQSWLSFHETEKAQNHQLNSTTLHKGADYIKS